MAVTYKKPVDDDLDWQQRLANYSGNKDAGMSEYQRALEVYRGKSAVGDTEGANAAKKWSDQVNTAIGGIGNNRSAQINNTTDTIGQKVNAAPFEFKQKAAPFQYNAQADPSYQAALREAQRNTQTAAGNTAAAMNARGIMDSTITTDRVGQQAQQNYGHVSDTILPQLMQQAYGRYQDENNNEYRNQLANYQAGQDQLGNLTKYAGTLNGLEQQDFNNNLATNQDKRAQTEQYANLSGYYDDPNTVAIKSKMKQNSDAYANASLEEKLRLHAENVKLAESIGGKDTTGNGDYSFGPGSRTLQGQTMDFNQGQVKYENAQNEKQREFENKLKTQMQGATIANMSGDNARGWAAEARQAGNQQLGNLFDVWDRTGVAPAGIPGVQPGTPIKDKNSSSSSKVDPKESANNYGTILGDLSADGVTREQAMQLAQANSPYLTDADYRKLLDTIQKQF